MTMVFLDTVGLLALWDASDQWHDVAEVAWKKLTEQRAALVTTASVLLECGNAAARRPYRSEVNHLRELLERRNEVLVPTQEEWKLAWQAYHRGDAASAGIVDHLSFAVMRRHSIQKAFTNDQHFRAAGFTTLF